MRRLLLYAWLSYRGLFTWLNPWGYLSTCIALPVTLTLLFGSVADYWTEDAAGTAIGALILTTATTAMFGVNLAVANERLFGTLGSWLSAPQSLIVGVLAKAVPHLLNAVLCALVTLAAATVTFGLPTHGPVLAAVALSVVAAAAAGCGLGITAGAISIRYRDAFTTPNLAQSLMLVATGAVAASTLLPAHLGTLGQVLPVTHAANAARAVVAGAALPVAEVLQEVAVGLGWGALGCALLKWLATQSRRSAAYDLH